MLTTEQASAAVVELAALVKYFPSGEAERAVIAQALTRLVDRPDRLRWLVDTLVNRIKEWPGFGEVRGIYCTRYRPADGVEANSAIAGFTAEDGEARSYDEHQRLKAGSWDEQQVRALPEPQINVAAIASRKRLTGRVM